MRAFLVTVFVAFSVLRSPVSMAQELTATRLHLSGSAWDGSSGALLYTNEVIPLVIANRSSVPQPIRFLAGASGSTRALEIGSAAETWIRGSLSVGVFTGAGPGEVARIGTIPSTGGWGLVVDLTSTSASTGILVKSVGTSGTDDAGIVLSSTSNGTGTGLRIGGPLGAGRPTLGTGIDITGGTGIRYNALTSGSGTGVDIGGTTPPWRGVDATAAGGDHIAVLGRANSNGAGVVGLSRSSSYPDVPLLERTGVYGHAASNSNAAADTLCGVRGLSIRGGIGGTMTFNVGVLGEAQNTSTNHSGYNAGVFGLANFLPAGQGAALGGLFITREVGMAVACFGGDVFLGSDAAYRPFQVPIPRFPQNSRNTTHLFNLQVSGVPRYVNAYTIAIPTSTVAADVAISDVPVIRIETGEFGADITGLQGGTEGRVVVLINMGDRLGIHNEGLNSNADNRIITPDHVVLSVPEDGSVTLWYDATDHRWRIIGASW